MGESATPADRLRAKRPDHVWALDYQFDVTATGRVIKILHVVDEFTHESLADLVDHNIDADASVASLDKIVGQRGCQIAPNTYWVARKRPPSARAMRDEYLRSEISRVHAENLAVYGADKVWGTAQPWGHRVARCTVERLMRQMGLTGARRGRAFKVTTRSDERQRRPDDLVDRQFKAPTYNRLWVPDLTYVRNFEGWGRLPPTRGSARALADHDGGPVRDR